MADESLKSSYSGIEADETEMARYRARLGPRLRERRHLRFWIPAAAAAAAAALLLAWVVWPPEAAFPQTDLAQVQALAADGPGVVARASGLAREGEGLDRWNSLMILCVAEPTEQAVMVAAQGIMEDPRPEFRAWYLEYLLDHADEYRYNRALLEERMDGEDDTQCLLLYRQIFRVASLQDRFLH